MEEKGKKIVKVLGEFWTDEEIASHPIEYLEHLKEILNNAKLNSIDVKEIEREFKRVRNMLSSPSNAKTR